MSRPTTPPDSRLQAHPSFDALRTLVEGTTAVGQAFFQALVVNLTRALGAKHALVGELQPPACDRSRVLAVAWDGQLGKPFTYELVGTPCAEVLASDAVVYHPSGVAERFPADLALRQRGVQAYLGVPLRAPDGRRLGLLVVMHDRPLDEGRDPLAVMGIFAARAAAELVAMRSQEELRHRDRMLRDGLQAARMAAFDWDLARGVSTWSEGSAELLGAGPGTFSGAAVALLAQVLPDDHALVAEAMRQVLAGERDAIDLRFRVCLPGGGERWIQQRGTVARGRDGRVSRVSGVMADLTERHQLEERLQQAEKLDAVGRLAGGIAHDFNNLLTVIRSFSEMAEDHLRDQPEAVELVVPIREAAQRGAGLTRQLLAFTRRQVVAPRLVEPGALIRALEKILRRLVGEQVALELPAAAPGWTVRIDPGQLEQVVVNLVVNARDASRPGGRVSVGIEDLELDEASAGARQLAAGPHVAIRVGDRGAGMDPATAARAFEPFFTTKGPERGTGLGLAICQRIVSQAGGAIWLESRPGQGTTVTLLLPRHQEAALAGEAAGPRVVPRGHETVLLVEDDEPVRAATLRALERLGYRVLAAGDGEEALRISEHHPDLIDVVVTDLTLPGLDGAAVVERIAAARPGLRALFTSGDRLPAGGGAFLSKPYAPVELAARIREVLSAPAGRWA